MDGLLTFSEGASAGSLTYAQTGAALKALRKRTPLVHVVTNSIVQNWTASSLLALGVHPSLSAAPDEIAEFTANSDALVINIGRLDDDRRTAILRALDQAYKVGCRWVLDPLMIDRSNSRRAFATDLLELQPDVLKLSVRELESFGASLAELGVFQKKIQETTVLVMGPIHTVVGQKRHAVVEGQHPYAAPIAGMSCSLGAIVAAFLSVCESADDAALAALDVYRVASLMAAERADGPGSFAIAFLDALYQLDEDDFARYHDTHTA